MFLVVEFLKTKSVGAVPDSWIEGTTCYYPSKNIKKLSRDHAPRSNIWQKHDIRIFTHADGSPRSFFKYEDAEKAVHHLLTTSDLSGVSSDENDDDVQKPTRQRSTLLPMPPSISNFNLSQEIVTSPTFTNSMECSTDENVTIRIANSITGRTTGDDVNAATSLSSPSFISTPKISRNTVVEAAPSMLTDISNNLIQSSFSGRQINKQPPNSEILQALKNVTKILLQVESRLESLENFVHQSFQRQVDGGEQHEINLPHLPTDTRDQINNLEEFITNSTNATALITHLRSVGGDSTDTTCKLVLQKLFTNNAANHVLWTGANGKMELQKMNIIKIIFGVVQKQHPLATEANVLSLIKKWFRRAGDRIRSQDKARKNK